MRYGRLFAGAAVALTAAALACLNDGPVAPGHESVRLQLHAQIVGQLVDPPPGAETVEIAVFYHRVAGDSLQLPSSPPSVTVAPGTTSQQALAVQLGACLADPLRVGAGEAGCRLSVSLRLLDAAGTTLDQQTTAPPAPVTPGQSVTIPTVTLHALPPVFLLSDSTAVFGAVLNGADPASDTISVTMDRGTARTVQATVSYAQSGQTWLSTALSADTTPARLALTSHIAGLAAGSYSATVTVQSDSTTLAPAPRTIAVTLTIFRVPVASVTMLPTADTITVGAADTIHAVPRDSASAVLAGRTVQWTSSDTTVATVSAASSVSNGDGASMGVTGVRAGSAYIRASVGGKSDSALVTVQPAPVGSISLSIGSDTIGVADTVAVTATVTDVNGKADTTRTVVWTTSAPSLLTITSPAPVNDSIVGQRAAVTGESQGGPVLLIATVEGHADTATFTVRNPVNAVTVKLIGTDSLFIGSTADTVVAVLTDRFGDTLTGRDITFSTTNPMVAILNNQFAADSVGIATNYVGGAFIKATSEGKSDSVQLTVQPETIPILNPCTTPAVDVKDINENDVVVGTCGGGTSWEWSPSTEATEITIPAGIGYIGVQVISINNNGDLAVNLELSSGGSQAAILMATGDTVFLPRLPGGAHSSVTKINDFDQVLGESDAIDTLGAPMHAVIWNLGASDTTVTDVEQYGAPPDTGGDSTVAVNMNGAGDVIVSNNGTNYLIHIPTRGDTTGATVTPLTSLLNANALNDSLQVAGEVSQSGTTLAALWRNGSSTVLNLSGGGLPQSASAMDINELGQISGSMTVGGIATAFFYSSATGMVSLGEDPVAQAQVMNNRGDAVGSAGGAPTFWCTNASGACSSLFSFRRVGNPPGGLRPLFRRSPTPPVRRPQ